MTLRDLAGSASEHYDAFVRDVGTALTTSPLDWPLYIVVISILLALIVYSVLSVAVDALVTNWQEFWAKHYDCEDNPTTHFGRIVNRALRAAFLIGVFILIWLTVGVLSLAIALAMFGYGGENDAYLWLVLIIPTLTAIVFLFLAIRGRNLSAKGEIQLETSGTEKE